MATYLVTGVGGFIGGHIAETLLNQGESVIGLDNGIGVSEALLHFFLSHPYSDNFKFIKGDIRSIEVCHKACEGVEYVSHHAALTSVPESILKPEQYHDANINGTLNMLIAARDAGVKRFVFASSSAVYGDSPILPKQEAMTLLPKSPYALNKAVGDQYCHLFYTAYGLPTVGLRYFNVFGPRQRPDSQYAAAIPKFVEAFLKGTSPTIFGDGAQTRDFVYVGDVVQANLLGFQAAEKAFGRTLNIGRGDPISVNELFFMIRDLLQSSLDPVFAPFREGDIQDSVADISLAKNLIGYMPQMSFVEGLKVTVEWYKREGGLELSINKKCQDD